MAKRMAPLGASPPRAPSIPIDALLMVAFAFGLRCWWFGDPVVQVDEQFYLLVGDRLLHGAVPFVDIWDRKPVGLFLVYAAIRLMGGSGIPQYQVAAALCAAAQALLVVRIARLHAGAFGARVAGIAALLWLIVFDGEGGQAPIFYGPLVAGAALLTFRSVLAVERAPGGSLRDGALVMLLIGIAIQIKYTALFEGMGLGCMLLHAGWRRGQSPAVLAAQAAAWIAVALLPTGLALAWYQRHGWGAAFVYANFRSIGQRPPTPPHVIVRRIALATAEALPLILAALAAFRLPARDARAARARRLIGLWLLAAVAGYLGIGTFFTHYALPVVLPLAALAAAALEPTRDARRIVRYAPVALVLAAGAARATAAGVHRLDARGDGREVDAMAAAIRPRLGNCLFVYDGEPILYLLTHSRLPTPYAFPNHLNEEREARAVGVDPAAEVRRVLAERPSVIVSSDRPGRGANPVTWLMMQRTLARAYRPVFEVPVRRRIRIVYARIA